MMYVCRGRRARGTHREEGWVPAGPGEMGVWKSGSWGGSINRGGMARGWVCMKGRIGGNTEGAASKAQRGQDLWDYKCPLRSLNHHIAKPQSQKIPENLFGPTSHPWPSQAFTYVLGSWTVFFPTKRETVEVL